MRRRRNTMEDILGSSDKLANQTRGVEGILASLFRQILSEDIVTGMKWANYMRLHLTDPNTLVRNTRKDHTNHRANINRELFDEKMTWKVFIKGLNFLRFKRMRITVELVRANGKHVVAHKDVNLSYDASAEDEDEKQTHADLSNQPPNGERENDQ